jgi:hypothetical protein
LGRPQSLTHTIDLPDERDSSGELDLPGEVDAWHGS